VLALLHREPGADVVAALLAGARLGAVNLSEVVATSVRHGIDVRYLARDLQRLGLRIEPFTTRHAEIAGALIRRTRPLGLSLGDRAALALAIETGLPVATADRAWMALDPSPRIRLIR
jgi:PIN domain nuclease of toxin-antitoxin system